MKSQNKENYFPVGADPVDLTTDMRLNIENLEPQRQTTSPRSRLTMRMFKHHSEDWSVQLKGVCKQLINMKPTRIYARKTGKVEKRHSGISSCES